MKDVLDSKIVNWLLGHDTKSKTRSGLWKWVTGAVAAIIALAGIAYFAYKEHKRGQELAKLKHEADVARETHKRLQREALIEEQEKAVEEKMAAIEKNVVKILALDKKLKAVEEDFLNTTEKLNAVENWKDMDTYLRDRGII